MATLDNLPADQRAVLQLVLQRGRSYDQIATLLSIDRSAVRERALSAVNALGPQTAVPDDRRAAVADYLLGQLESGAVDMTREAIAASPSERAWARVVASELAPLAGGPLPEIPSAPSASPLDLAPEAPVVPTDPEEPTAVSPPEPPAVVAPPDPPTGVHPPVPAPGEGVAPGEPEPPPAPGDDEPKSRRPLRRGRRERKPKEPEPLVPDTGGRRSSRLGGTVLIALTVVIVAVIAIILLSSGSTKKLTPTASSSSSSTPAATSSTPTSGTSTASGSGTTPAKVVAQINLTPPTTGSKAAGIAEVLKEGATDGIAIVAQNVPPNTTKPPNAYAVWLYNSPTDAHILGFVNPGVGANGRLSTAGGLPANAAHYKQLIVTVESKASPTSPGTIILQGTLTGL